MTEPVALDPATVEELAEFLAFLIDLTEFDGRRVAAALEGLTAWSYGLDDLRADLDRFVTLLGRRAIVFGAHPSRGERRHFSRPTTGP